MMKSKWFVNLDGWKVVSMGISIISLVTVLYKDFIQGFNLSSSIDQIILMRTPGENKQNLLQEMLFDDLVADSPSKQGQKILLAFPALMSSVQSKNRDKLRIQLTELSKGKVVNYDPPEYLVEKYSEDKRFGSSFYIPLVVFNSGKKFAHVSSL